MKNSREAINRRSVLRLAVQAAIGAGASMSGLHASPVNDRALVCIYLSGGNDSAGMVVPFDQYESYAAARRALRVPRGELLEAGSIGFHPALGAVRDLYQEGVLAVVPNVGTLSHPAATAPSGHLDPMLSYLPGGYSAPRWATEWSGSGSAIRGFRAPDTGFGTGLVMLTPRQRNASQLGKQHVARTAAARVGGFPSTSLGQHLRQVAASLAVSGGLGPQVYFVPAAGFDTHVRQATQASLWSDLDRSLAAFRAATLKLGVADRVTVYTDSEFSRALVPNGRGGTGHGWGGAQLIMGGGAQGGRVHGEFPNYSANVFVPTVSRVQYAATLATWVGAGFDEISRVMPELQNFSQPVLGFVA